MENIHTQMRSI